MPTKIMGSDQKKGKSLNLPNHRERIKLDQGQKPKKKKKLFFCIRGKTGTPFKKWKRELKKKEKIKVILAFEERQGMVVVRRKKGTENN